MSTSRAERFTVIQTNGLAQSRIRFPTENEPIFRYRRLGLNPVRGAHFAGIQTEANPLYAIQKTAANSVSGRADHQGAPAAISILAFARSATKNKGTKPFLTPRPPRQSARRHSQKIQVKSQFARLSPGQPACERSREGAGRRRFRATRPSRLVLTRRPACPTEHCLALAVWSMYSWQATCRI